MILPSYETEKMSDFAREVIRCAAYMIQESRKGMTQKTIIRKAKQSYGYSIYLNAQLALNRAICKKN